MRICARRLLTRSARIFEQMDDDCSMRQAEQIVVCTDEQFQPGQTAARFYGRLFGNDSSVG